jgi:Na+-transporting methylmalonyl-CoA/oxaloacetate decarboxylase beta subunit
MDLHKLVHLFHILIVGSLFLYVGINREKNPRFIFPVLFYLGIVIILYHTYKLLGYLKENKGIWVNLIHILIVGPLLIYIGYCKEKTARLYFELLLMLGFAAIGYHLYYLF